MKAKTLVTVLVASAMMTVTATTAVAIHEDPDEDCEIGPPPGEVIAVGSEDPMADNPDGMLYLNVRGTEDPPEQDVGVFLYQESNGIPGLQVGGPNPTQELLDVGYTDDGLQSNCGHHDTLIA